MNFMLRAITHIVLERKIENSPKLNSLKSKQKKIWQDPGEVKQIMR